jgi:hypothetical protein
VSASNSQPRRIGRSIGALALGFVVVVALSIGTDVLLRRVGWYPPLDQPMVDPAMLSLALFYRAIYGVIGAYVTAAFAPRAPMAHALASGALGFIICVTGMIVMWNYGPNWYPIALTLTTLPGAWLGGSIQQKRFSSFTN